MKNITILINNSGVSGGVRQSATARKTTIINKLINKLIKIITILINKLIKNI